MTQYRVFLAAIAAAFILSACSGGGDSSGEIKTDDGQATPATDDQTVEPTMAPAETNTEDQDATQDADSTETEQTDQSTEQTTQQSDS